jgi:hypothetical protein
MGILNQSIVAGNMGMGADSSYLGKRNPKPPKMSCDFEEETKDEYDITHNCVDGRSCTVSYEDILFC